MLAIHFKIDLGPTPGRKTRRGSDLMKFQKRFRPNLPRSSSPATGAAEWNNYEDAATSECA